MQYARSKVDYVIGEFIYMLLSDMNLRIGKVKNYNNKILISSPSFKIGTNLKINIDGEQVKLKDKPDVESKEVKTEPDVKLNKKHKQDAKPNIKFKRESKQDVKKLDTNKITYEEEKVALILGTTAVFTVWWMFKQLPSPCICHEICVYQNNNTCDKCPQVLRYQPTTSLALFKIHEIIEPIIPGSDADTLSANLPNNCDRAFNLFLSILWLHPFYHL